MGEDISGDELEGLLSEPVPQELPPARRQRTAFPFPNRPTSENQKEVIRPLDLADGEYDYQGIPWPRFSISRADYRTKRVREYSNYNNVNWTAQLEMQRRLDISQTLGVRTDFFSFAETYKTVNPTIDHFQLRHLVWSANNVLSYVASNSSLYEFNKRTRQARKIQACSPQQLASCHVDLGLAVTGAFDSEVKICATRDPSVVAVTKVSQDPNSITNHVVVADRDRIVVANNDSNVSEIAVSDGAARVVSKFKWTTAVNHVSVSPGGSVLCLTGDSCDVSLMDRRSGRISASLAGHLDFSFCSSWNSDWLVCTGSQDGTCRVWDVRNTARSVACLGSLLGAVRCAKFSPDGRYLALSEPADFVHIYDVKGGLREVQLLDFFGNIGGIAFSPDGSRLSVALADTMFGCLVDFQTGELPINTLK
jgi:WD40 repeat protein